MNVWESNDALRQTRGMEFSNTPIDGTMKRLVQRQQIWGVPVYDWLNAKGKLQKDYAAFALSIPDGFHGVADVSIAAGKLNIGEKRTGKKIVLDWRPDAK